MTMEQAKEFIDKYLQKFISRKLLVFIITTVLLLTGYVTNEQWMAISVAYVGVEGFADIVLRYISAKQLQ